MQQTYATVKLTRGCRLPFIFGCTFASVLGQYDIDYTDLEHDHLTSLHIPDDGLSKAETLTEHKTRFFSATV